MLYCDIGCAFCNNTELCRVMFKTAVIFSRSHVWPARFVAAVRSEELLDEVNLNEAGGDDDNALSQRPESKRISLS